jgi:hypothetical protein
LELADVTDETDVWEVLTEDALGLRVDLAEEDCSMTRLVEADFDAPDTGEQPDHGQGSTVSGRRRLRRRYVRRHQAILGAAHDRTNMCS